jgi:hypothetical protein
MPKTTTLLKYTFATTAAAAVAFSIGVWLPLREFAPAPGNSAPTVIDDVTLIDPRSGTATARQTVIIAGNRIAYAGPSADAPLAEGARHIAGSGKYLIPGLWDAHVHTLKLSPQLHFPLLLANGVTSVRDMGDGCSWSGNVQCVPDAPAWKARIEQGTLLAPRLAATASFHVESLDSGDSRMLVAALKARGDGFIKLQLDQRADPAVFHAMVRQAAAQGMRIAGHLPFTVDLLDPLSAPLHSIEHDTSLLPQCAALSPAFDGRNRSKAALLARFDEKRCDAVLAAMAERGTAYVPTHTASSGQDWQLLSGGYAGDARVAYVPAPQRWMWRLYAGMAVAGTEAAHRPVLAAYYRAARQLTQRAQARAVTILAGSDALDPYVTHGFGLHDELVQLVQAGLTPADALRAATWAPARHFGLARDLGTVEAGKLADMVLLDDNPLQDIRHARAIHTLVFNGNVYPRRDLDAMLAYTRDQASSFGVACKILWGMLKPG